MVRYYPEFWENLRRYLTAAGEYPYRPRVRTPTGEIGVTLYTHHDMLTLNEIFCREDYRVQNNIKVIVDIGSNIGLSALYFLTRNSESFCHLYEPNPENAEKLIRSLADFSGRFNLERNAVADFDGTATFGVEPTGRYGGLSVETGQSIEVRCLHINAVIEKVLEQHSSIDVLKIDTEGTELDIVQAIDPRFHARIFLILAESVPNRPLLAGAYRQFQYGSVCRLESIRR